jgi:hypothetical protein
MGNKTNQYLFKDRITRSEYRILAEELIYALNRGPEELKKLLFDSDIQEQYSFHGKFREGHHNQCLGLNGERFTEKRLCKCMYYYNSNYKTKCAQCDFKDRFGIVGEYKISDYEVPAFYYGDGIGEIDLIISDGNIRYATEVKPYKNNDETLLRMISEILTYTAGFPIGTYQKAIAFFEKNPDDGKKTFQQKEYEKMNPQISELLDKAHITVFRFEETNDKGYRICKL